MEPDRTRHRSRFGVTARLVALVMLPVTVMCLLVGSVVSSHWSLAQRADSIDDGVVVLTGLVELRAGLHQELSAAEFDVRFGQVGVTRAEAIAFIGFDWGSEVSAARAKARRAAASLGAASPVLVSTLVALQSDIDDGSITPAVAAKRLGDLAQLTGDAVAGELNQLQVAAREVPLLSALESVRTASNLVDVTTPQVIDLSSIWFPTPGDTPEATAAVLARFGAESANYATAIARLQGLGVPGVLASLGGIDANSQVQAYAAAVAASLLGQPLTPDGAVLDTAKVATAFRGQLVLDRLLDGVVVTAASAARTEARGLAGDERTSFLWWSVGGVALALASIAVALWLARTISRPLKDLAAYAHAVNEGQLDAQPSTRRHRGPRETQVAFEVFTDLTSNLQLLDAKANALALCDFDNPVLQEPLPGRLGRSLESSVAVLSGSIVERDQLQTHLAHLATHDSLTGIFNRPAAITAIQSAVQRGARTGSATALLFVDLNDFKAVNDSHGHEVGDEVLRQVAARMTACMRTGDFAARLGGDEFVVVAEGVASGVDGVADTTTLARRIVDTVGEPIEVGTLRIKIGAAVGIALSLDGPEEPLRLLARADAAMYRAKVHEGSAIEIFDAGLQQQMLQREDIEAGLTAALADPDGGGLQLHYQPVIDARSGALVGAEALIRWERPSHGLLFPDSFVAIAEATMLVIDMDCWVLTKAARQLIAWSSVAELAGVPVSVNISGRHLLSRQLPGHLKDVIDQTGIDPRRLIVEITETVLLTDLVAAADEIDAVRALGVKIAIDDFGTGFTSLAHLQKLRVDTIKIDRSFIKEIGGRRGNSLVRLVTDLGHAININIVAEGVETVEEMRALQEMGADQVQGFLLSCALEPAALVAWARTHDEAGRVLLAPISQG